MKVDVSGNNQQTSISPLKTFAYKLDDSAEAVALIAETLRKSYKYPIMTSVQEYLSNARDIHRELKIKKAIDVQLPTKLNPEFYIRDYGSGLSIDQMADYITFAKSTKRNSNLATGGFGFGSKSFFSYADSFTIISYHEGIQYTYRASCVKSKEGALTLINQTATKEPNGLLVQVAVRDTDRSAFKDAVVRIKTFWTDQEVNILNLGEQEYIPQLIKCEAFSNVTLWKNHDNSNSGRNYNYNSRNNNTQLFLLVDGISYDLENLNFNNNEIANFISGLDYNYKVSISIPTGSVNVSKYREYIESTPENIKKISAMILEMITEVKKFQLKSFPKVATNFNELDLTKVESNLIFSRITHAPIKIGSKEDAVQIQMNNGNIQLTFTQLNSESTDCLTVSPYRLSADHKLSQNSWSHGFNFSLNRRNQNDIKYKTNFQINTNCLPQTFVDDGSETDVIRNQRIKNACLQSANVTVIKITDKATAKEKQFLSELIKFLGLKPLTSVDRLIPEKIASDGSKGPKISKFNYEPWGEVFDSTRGGHIRKLSRKTFTTDDKLNSPKVLITESINQEKTEDIEFIMQLLFMGFNVWSVSKTAYEELIKKENTYSYETVKSGEMTLVDANFKTITSHLQKLFIYENQSQEDRIEKFEQLESAKILSAKEVTALKSITKYKWKDDEYSFYSNAGDYWGTLLKQIKKDELISNFKELETAAEKPFIPFKKMLEKYYFLDIIEMPRGAFDKTNKYRETEKEKLIIKLCNDVTKGKK